MALDISNTDKLNLFRQELDRLRITVMPPDVNASEASFSVEDGKVRYALGALKNVGIQAMEQVAAERRRGGRYKSLFDFASRLGPQVLNKRALESLAKAGALDSLNPNRAQVLAAIDLMLAHAGNAAAERESRQASIFGDVAGSEPVPTLPQVEPFRPLDRLAHEFDAVGFYLSGHPLDGYRNALARARVSTIAEVTAGQATRVRLAGVVLRRQERRAKSGSRFAFVEFSDPTGRFEAICFSELLGQARDLLEPGKAVVVTCDADREGEEVKLRLQGVEPIDQVTSALAGGLRIHLDDPGVLPLLKSRLTGGGKDQVTLVLRPPGESREIEVTLPGRYVAGPPLRMALEGIAGIREVEEL